MVERYRGLGSVRSLTTRTFHPVSGILELKVSQANRAGFDRIIDQIVEGLPGSTRPPLTEDSDTRETMF